MTEEHTNHDPDDDVVLGDLIEAAPRPEGRPRMSIVAVRVGPDLLRQAIAYGKLNGLTLSAVFRLGIEQLTDPNLTVRPSVVSMTVYTTEVIMGTAASGRTLTPPTVERSDLLFTEAPAIPA